MADLSSTKIFGKLTVIHDAVVKGNAEITGTLSGDGSGLTSMNASNLSAGTVPTSRLPSSALIGDTTYSAGTGLALSGTTFSLSDQRYTLSEKNKLSGIESGATADQSANEIKSLYESNSNTNSFTDSQKTKVNSLGNAGERDIYFSTSDPSNTVGNDGDIYFQYSTPV